MLGEEGDRGDKNFLEWGGATLVGDNQVGCCDFGASGFDTRDCFLLWLSSSRLCSGCRISIGLLKPGRLPGGGHIRLLERLRDRLRRGILIWGGVLVALSKRPLGRRDSTLRPGPSARQRFRPAELSLRWGGGAISDTHGRLLCWGRLRFFPLITAPVVHCAVTTTATELRLRPRGRVSKREVGAPTRDARNRHYVLCIQSAGIAVCLLELM